MNLLVNQSEILQILFINFVIAVINLIIRLFIRQYAKAWITSLLIIISPVVGPAYLFFSWLFYMLIFKNQKDVLNMHELSMSKNRIEVINKANTIGAMNIVPFEEAFIISDNASVRRLLLDALKQNKYGSMQQILRAVSHKDSEVAHYAAAAISEIIDEFFINEKKLKKIMEKEKKLDLCYEYLEYAYSYLSKHILAGGDQKYFLLRYENAVGFLDKHFPEEVSGELYYRLVDLRIELGDIDGAYPWVQKSLLLHKDDLESYKAGLKYYHAARKREEFLSLKEELMSADIFMDHETVEMIRFFVN